MTVEPVQDDKPLHQADSVKKLNEKGTLAKVQEPIQENAHEVEHDSQENTVKYLADTRDIKASTLMPVLNNMEQTQSLGSGERTGKLPHIFGVQKTQNIKRNISTEQEFYEDLSGGRHGGSQNPNNKQGKGSQSEPLLDLSDRPVNETIPVRASDSSLVNESLPKSERSRTADLDHTETPITAGRQNPKRLKALKDNSTLEQMAGMSIEKKILTPRQPQAASTVKVTIGRVEVRAVTPPQAPQTQALPPRQHPILSLDDYLKQHNG